MKSQYTFLIWFLSKPGCQTDATLLQCYSESEPCLARLQPVVKYVQHTPPEWPMLQIQVGVSSASCLISTSQFCVLVRI